MKNRAKKPIIFSILFIVIISIAVFIINENTSGKFNSSKVEEIGIMSEELPNGQSKVVPAVVEEEETNEWFYKKETELTSVITEQMKLQSNNVSIMLTPLSTTEKAESMNVSCSVILKTDSTFDNELLNKLVENIVRTISTNDAINATINEENITIMNSNNVVLY